MWLSGPGPSSERVYKTLRHQILTGVRAPGARLVELNIARELHVSRTPVREALKRLGAEALVHLEPVRGMVVSEVDARELEDILVIRETLEGLAARLAAERLTAADLTKLRLLVEMLRDSARSGRQTAMIQANLKFHDVVHYAAGNERLRLLSRDLLDFVQRFSLGALAGGNRGAEVIAEHERILAALDAHDPDLAERAARDHVANVRSHLISRHLSRLSPLEELGSGSSWRSPMI